MTVAAPVRRPRAGGFTYSIGRVPRVVDPECRGASRGYGARTVHALVVGLMTSEDAERHNDDDVSKRRQRSPQDVVGEYTAWSGRAAAPHSAMQKPGMGAIPMRLAELGTHPARLMTSAAVFNTSVHLRQDIAPAVGRDLGAVPDNTLAVTLEWMFAGLAPMNRESLSWLDAR